MVYLMVFLLFGIGIYCVLAKKNLIKIIIGIGIIEYALNLLFVILGYRYQGRAPILAPDQVVTDMVDPLPQAVVLTAIVIGLATTALLVAVAVRLYEKYGTFDITKIRKLRG